MNICEICDATLPPQTSGRPRRYCSPRCKHAARVWRGVDRVIERARAEGHLEFAAERAEWAATMRADARNDWAGAKAKVEEANRRIREYR